MLSSEIVPLSIDMFHVLGYPNKNHSNYILTIYNHIKQLRSKRIVSRPFLSNMWKSLVLASLNTEHTNYIFIFRPTGNTAEVGLLKVYFLHNNDNFFIWEYNSCFINHLVIGHHWYNTSWTTNLWSMFIIYLRIKV